MSLFTKLGNEIASPVDAAGNPRAVENVDMQRWMTEVERATLAFQAGGGIVFPDLDTANASLAYAQNQMAWVIGDPVPANNGVYRKIGASGSGSWARLGDLPISMIRLDNAGAGTADAIIAEPMLPLPTTPGAALLTVNILAANTGSVTLNGKPLRTNSGNEIAPGGLTAGSIHAFLDMGDHFRLLSDQASGAIVAAAEAAQAAAESAAGANLSNADSVEAAKLTNIPGSVNYIRTAGYAVAGDGGGALYKRVLTEPDHPGKFQSADGAWWELASGQVVTPRMFGAVGDGVTDDADAVESALRTGFPVRADPGVYYCGRQISVANMPIHLTGAGPYATTFLFSAGGTDEGFKFLVRSTDSFTLRDFSVVTASTTFSADKVGIEINNSSQIINGFIGDRSRGRGLVENVHVRADEIDAGWGRHLDFVSVGWFTARSIFMRGKGQPPATPYQGLGLVIRGEGAPVEIYIHDINGYNLSAAISAPDYLEGVFISNYNFVNCTDGILLGVYNAALSTLAEGNCGVLAPVIGSGHCNVARRGIYLNNVNQAEVRRPLIYLDDRGFSTFMRGIEITNGGGNVIDRPHISCSPLVTATSAVGVRFGGSVGVGNSKIFGVVLRNIVSTPPFTEGISINISSVDNEIDDIDFNGPSVAIALPAASLRTRIGSRRKFANVTTLLADASSSAIIEPKRHVRSTVITLTGGSPSETVDVSIPAGVFDAKPRAASLEFQSGSAIFVAMYDRDAAANSPTNARFVIRMADGGNVPAGAVRFGFVAEETM